MAKTEKPLPDAVRNFDDLPDSAQVDSRTVKALYCVSDTTLWRRVRDGSIPKPLKCGPSNRWRVGDLRAAMLGEAA